MGSAVMTPQDHEQRARRNRILALLHVVLALAILGAFVYVQASK